MKQERVRGCFLHFTKKISLFLTLPLLSICCSGNKDLFTQISRNRILKIISEDYRLKSDMDPTEL